MPDLFAIDCTTCKSRLRVRDAAIVGQILACPKCSSMVLIEPPPGWQPPTTVPQESAATNPAVTNPAATKASAASVAVPNAADSNSLKETVSDSDFREVDAMLGDAPAKPSPQTKPVTPQTAPSSPQPVSKAPKPAGDKPREKRHHTPPTAPAPPGEQANGAGTATSGEVASAATAPVDWTPTRTKRLRLLAMLTLAGCVGVVSAMGAATYIASWASGQRTSEVAENSGPRTTPVTTPSSETASSAPPESEAAQATNDEATDATTPPKVEVAPTPPEVVQEPRAEEKPAEPAATTKTPENEKPQDPLGLVNDAPPEPASEANDPLKLNGLRQLAKLLPGEEMPVPAEPSSAMDSAEDMASEPETASTAESRPRPEMRKIDMAARLADRLTEIEFNGQPLSEVVQFLSDFSTIPITIEPEALIWSRITPAAPVKSKLTNATLHEVLIEVLKPFRLEPVVVGEQVVVTRSPNLRLIKCPIDDLTDGDADRQQQLIEFIEQLAAPTSWKSAGGEGTIVPQGDVLLVENNELAYGDVLQVCERLRLARGGRPKSVFPAEVFALERRSERAAKKLDTPLTLNFSQPTLLVKILQRFGKESGTTILVDWRALAEVGWPTEADATVTINKTPLRQALVELLAPMDLTYRVVDGQTLQVTTPQAVERQPELEVHSVADLASSSDEATALIERIAPMLGDNAVLRYDAPSKSLFALLPQPQQEQLAESLAEMRTK
jgi:hypothetical protein